MRCKLPETRIMKHKRGLWSPDEDQKLTYYLMSHGHGCWSSVPINAGLQRNGKSCRLRWINYLRPGLKRGPFSSQEDETISTLHGLLGNKWSEMARHLPGRTDNEIKNYWHGHLKKKVDKSKHVQVLFELDTCITSPSLYTSNFTNTSSSNTVQSVPQVSEVSNLPKLLFADWISLDEFQQDFSVSCDQPLSHVSNNQVSPIEYKGSPEGCQKGSVENENMLEISTIDQPFEFDDGDFDIENFIYIQMKFSWNSLRKSEEKHPNIIGVDFCHIKK